MDQPSPAYARQMNNCARQKGIYARQTRICARQTPVCAQLNKLLSKKLRICVTEGSAGTDPNSKTPIACFSPGEKRKTNPNQKSRTGRFPRFVLLHLVTH